MKLDGKVAIVTGASSGIGAALTKALAHRGVRLALMARRRDRLEEVAAACDGETLVVPGDVTVYRDRGVLVDATLNRWGRIDLLFNNAGIGAYGSLTKTSEADWRHVFDVNVFGPVMLTQAVLPLMLARGEGVVVNVASIGGLLAHADNLTQYVASKHALVGFSRALAVDLRGTGVRVLAVCPHLTDTELFATARGAEEMADVVEEYRSFMDTPEAVAEGIMGRLESERVVVFPTEMPARAFDRHRDI